MPAFLTHVASLTVVSSMTTLNDRARIMESLDRALLPTVCVP